MATEGVTRASLSEQVFNRAGVLTKEFADRFNLRVANCLPDLTLYGVKQSDQCLSFWNFKKEGIMVFVSYDGDQRKATLALVKESRVFGEYTRGNVEEQFQTIVLSPLIREFGERNVRIEK